MEEQIQFKLILFLDGEENAEVRRFAVDKNTEITLNYLRTKFLQVFPVLTGKDFSIFWTGKLNIQYFFKSL